jgi:hypothetical protein
MRAKHAVAPSTLFEERWAAEFSTGASESKRLARSTST